MCTTLYTNNLFQPLSWFTAHVINVESYKNCLQSESHHKITEASGLLRYVGTGVCMPAYRRASVQKVQKVANHLYMCSRSNDVINESLRNQPIKIHANSIRTMDVRTYIQIINT